MEIGNFLADCCLWLYSSGYMCAVQVSGARCEHLADYAPVYLPRPNIPYGVVL